MLSVSFNSDEAATFENQSKALERFHSRDYSPALSGLKKMFPKSWSKIALRTCPFIYSVARELGSLYSVDPSRSFSGITSPDVENSMRLLFESARVTEAMRQAHEFMVIQGSCGIVILPDMAGRLTLHVLAPWRINPVRKSPLVTDERSVDEWRIRLPRAESMYGTIEDDDLILTRDKIEWSDGAPLFESSENPISPAIPVVVLRAAPATGGKFWPPVNADLLDAQMALILGYSDLGAIIHAQGWGQRVITGGSIDAAEFQVGPDTIMMLESENDYKVVSGDANVPGFVQSLEAYLKLVLSQNKVDPSALLSSGAYTAASRIIERADREMERRIHQKECVRAEQRIYRHIARWANAIRGLPVFPVSGVTVGVDFHEFQQQFDPLHESQASQIRAQSGLESIVEQIAKERGISKAQAEAVLEDNLATNRRVRESEEPAQEPAALEAVNG